MDLRWVQSYILGAYGFLHLFQRLCLLYVGQFLANRTRVLYHILSEVRESFE